MPFQKGESGNPAGRPKGVTDRRHLVRDLLLPDAPDLVSKAVELALQGDPVMLKACLDKLIPNARPSTAVKFSSDASLATSGRSLISLVSNGQISLEEGSAALSLLAIQAKVEEHDTLVARISALEEAQGVN